MSIMKRVNNIYYKLFDINNIISAYKEVMKTTRNKNYIVSFDRYKCIQINKIYKELYTKSYIPGNLREITIYEPKERVIVVQNIYDKVINHLVSRQILIPYLTNCLIDSNVASRAGFGTNKAIPIGLMSSQIFAIFYLDSLDKYIKEDLKIKGYIRYQDDMVLFHKDKEYLKYCLSCIKIELEKLGLQVNKKTRIYKDNENMHFIGVKRNGKLVNYQKTRKKAKKTVKEYKNGERELSSVISSLNYLKGVTKK